MLMPGCQLPSVSRASLRLSSAVCSAIVHLTRLGWPGIAAWHTAKAMTNLDHPACQVAAVPLSCYLIQLSLSRYCPPVCIQSQLLWNELLATCSSCWQAACDHWLDTLCLSLQKELLAF